MQQKIFIFGKNFNQMSTFLADAAKRLGADDTIMHSYWEYHERRQNWFFSPNPNLASATRRPSSLPKLETWKKLNSKERIQEWNRYSTKQRMTISTLAGFGYEAKGISLDKTSHYTRLQQAINQWRHDLYSVFWSNKSTGKLWLCNVFVGDAIYMYNGSSFTSGNDHYYDPDQISLGKSNLKKRNHYKEVRVGDIVLLGKDHVEIITKINYNLFYDHGFCSIGAGRGLNPEKNEYGDGKEKCDYFAANGRRELENIDNFYYYL